MAFIRDERAKLAEAIQGRQFLRSGIQPTVGQRVDLTLNLANRDGKRPNAIFSGFVICIKPEPRYYPMANGEDKDGSMMLSEILAHPQFRPTSIPETMTFHACDCPDPDCDGGLICMTRQVWDDMSAEGAATHCLCQHNVVPIAARNTGAKHGQEVVCEGRLHFDHDSKFLNEYECI